MQRIKTLTTVLLGVVLTVCCVPTWSTREPPSDYLTPLTPPPRPTDRWPRWEIKLISGVLKDKHGDWEPNAAIPPLCGGDLTYDGRIAYEYAFLYKCRSDGTFAHAAFHPYQIGFPREGDGAAKILQFKDLNLHLVTTHSIHVDTHDPSCHGGSKLKASFIVWWVTKPNISIPPPPSNRAMDPHLPFWTHVIAHDRTDFTLECCCD